MARQERQGGGQVSPLGIAAAVWGILGVVVILLRPISGLTPVALDALNSGLSALHWVAAILWMAFMAWSEGYRGFQRGFSPRVVARAVHLSREPRPVHVLLAPLFCMGLIHASRRRLLTSWGVLVMVVLMVVSVRFVPQPYRGIIDSGVVLGLVWGLVAIVAYAVRAISGRFDGYAVDLPERT